MPSAPPTPLKLNLKKDEQLEILWSDGVRSVWPIATLRALCPCAVCKVQREQRDPHALMQPAEQPKKSRLTVLPGNYSKPLAVTSAELVGNYALRLDWSDGHGSGIYSFQYLREISPQQA